MMASGINERDKEAEATALWPPQAAIRGGDAPVRLPRGQSFPQQPNMTVAAL
jgi:hypothetical protein